DAEVGGVVGAVHRAGATVRVQGELAGVLTGVDDDLAHEVGGLRVLDGVDRGGGVVDGHAERCRDDLVDGVAGELDVETFAAAEEVVRVDDAEHEIGVGDGRLPAAVAVARGPGTRARA